MIKKISLRWRLTLLTSLLIALCCIGLSAVLNISAYRMADSIDATVIQPANPTDESITDTPSMPLVPSSSAETTRLAKHSYRMESLLYTIIAVLVGGVLTYYIAGKALEPVRALNEQVKNINSHTLNESLEVPLTKDELAELTVSFNDMTDKLAEAFAVQKRFSVDAAHELRTPLAVLQTKLDVFRKKKEHTKEEYEALTSVFQKQVSRLRGLVTELLDIANMEHELEMRGFSIQQLVNDVVKELSDIAEEKNISVTADCGDIYICGDYKLLYRAFYNLTENAIKYNITGGNVEIFAKSKAKNITVTVSDTGIGIPNSQKEQIFNAFYRVDKSRSREMGGAGLGLSLVDTIIKKHGGTITVSDNKGGGSRFIVVLPQNE